MGKHKTKIEKIANAKNRHLAFYKRKKGLLKKAMELSIMCDVHIFLGIFNTNNKKCAEFTTAKLQDLINMYNGLSQKDISVFAPNCEVDRNGKINKITPMEFNANNEDKLKKSASLIKSTKDNVSSTANKRKRSDKMDEISKSELEDSESNNEESSQIVSKSNKSKKKKAPKTTKTSKRQKVSDSDDDSEEDVSAIDADDASYYDDKSNQADTKNDNLFNHITEGGKTTSKILFSPSPTSFDISKNINNSLLQRVGMIDQNSSEHNKTISMTSPGFQIQEVENTPVTMRNMGTNGKDGSSPNTYAFKNMVSPDMIHRNEESKSPNDGTKDQKGESVNKFISFNHSSKTDGNHSFTFDNQGNMSASVKSPGSFANFPAVKNSASPNLLFSSQSDMAKNGHNSLNQAVSDLHQNIQIEKAKNAQPKDIMKMLEEISDLPEESLAATKAKLKGEAAELSRDASDKKKKRLAKLKKKAGNLKVDVPKVNPYLEEMKQHQVNEAQVSSGMGVDSKSPPRKLYTPTPTKKIVAPGDCSNNDPILFWNQLSNKGIIHKGINESPFLLNQETKGNAFNIGDPKYGTPLKNMMMSPGSISGNNDLLKFINQLSNNNEPNKQGASNSYFGNDNRDSAFMNASPYVSRPTVSQSIAANHPLIATSNSASSKDNKDDVNNSKN